MISEWVLVLVILATRGNAITEAEMVTREACTRAAQAYAEQETNHNRRQAICIRRTTGESIYYGEG